MFGSGLFSFGFIRLDFLILFGNYCEYCPFCGEILFLLFSVIYFVSDVCLSIYYSCLLLYLLLVCWVRENFSGGPGHIFPVWDSAVWSAGPVPFISVLAWSGWRDCTCYFSSLAFFL